MKIYKVRCDCCGAEERREKDRPEPMLHLAVPEPSITGTTRHHDFCDIVCLAKWSAEEAAKP